MGDDGAVELVHLHADEVILATGAAELHPVCPGNGLRGLFTASAARAAVEAGIDLPDAVAIGAPPDGVPCRAVPGRLLRFEGESGWVTAVVVEEEGAEEKEPTKGSSVRTPAGRSSSVSVPRPATSWPAWLPECP